MDLFNNDVESLENDNYIPAMIINSNGIVINDPIIMDKVASKKLSPSMITGLEGCHASWVAKSFVIPDIIVEEPDNAARRGSAFHKVMEDLFALDPSERTVDKLKELTNNVLSSGEFSDLAQYPDALQWMRTIVTNYIDMGAKPEKVEIADFVDSYGNTKKGIELFVSGNIGDTDRDILGFIDLLVQHPKKDNHVIVQDWKTGKVKKWNPNTKSTEGLGEARQQTIYSMLLEQMGYNVSGARLIFPYFKEVVNVDIFDDKWRNRVISDIQATSDKLNHNIDSNLFEYDPGVLCAWCPLAKICPSVKIVSRKQNFTDAYESQPDIDILERGFMVE